MTDTYRVIVCGGRDYTNRPLVVRVLSLQKRRHPNLTIIEGGAKGADAFAEEFATINGLGHEQYPANWKKYGWEAGPIRNRQMAESGADLCIAFPGGRGTKNMIEQAKRAGVEVIEIAEPVND